MKMSFHIYILLILYIGVNNVVSGNKNSSVSGSIKRKSPIECEGGTLLSKSICIPKHYHKGEVPETPTLIDCRIEVNNIREVNDKRMRVTLEIYQESLWIDNRINSALSLNEFAVLNNNMIDLLWKPDLWIENLHSFKLHSILEPTAGLIILKKELCSNDGISLKTVREKRPRVDHCGNLMENKSKENTMIMYNLEALVELNCNFNFANYPMDSQRCEFNLDSAYSYPDIVSINFEQGQFGATNNDLNLDEFTMNILFLDQSNETGVHMVIQLDRCILPYVIRYYLPCIAVVIVSLIHFFIPDDSIPARTVLLVTGFLTLTNILISQQVCLS